MVMQAPLLHLLHRRYGEPCKLLSFGGWSHQLYENSADVGTIWDLRLRHVPYLLSPQRWTLKRELKQHDGPIYVSEDIPRHVKRVRQLLKHAGISADRCLFLDDCDHIKDVHWVDRLLALGRMTPPAWRAADYRWNDDDLLRAPCLYASAADRNDCEAWLAEKKLADTRLVLMQPGNKRTSRRIASRQRRDSKAWPVEHWVALISAVVSASADFRVVLCGSPHERALLEEIRSRAGFESVVVATRELPLRRLLALAERAHSMVGVDTGPLHVAAAAGCPLVVLYGAESPARWDRRSPEGSPVFNLGGPPRKAVDEIAVEEVVAAWRRIPEARRARSGQ